MSSSPSHASSHVSDAIALLYRNSIGGIVICLIASAVLVFAFPESGLFENKVLWWIAISALMLVRLVDTWCWHRYTKTSRNMNPKFWLNKFRVGAVLTAVLWGVFGALTMSQMGDVEFVATVIILAALAGAAPTPLSADRFLAIVYSSLLIAPISVAGLLDEQYMRQILGGMGVMFSFTMIFSALKITGFTQEAIALKNHNDELLKQTSYDKRKLALQNQKLEESNQEVNDIKDGLEEQVRMRTRELLELSQRDPLTGLFNRTAFMDQLQEALLMCKDSSNSIAVFFMDVNKFKSINDTLGHGTGDKVLLKIAESLSRLPGNPTVSRWGGDEFVLFTKIATGGQALQYGEAINAEIHKSTKELDFDVTVSIGVALSHKHSIDANELVKLADIAMFEHKKDPVFVPAIVFESRFAARLQRTEDLRNGLLTAISNNEMSLVYQPVFDLHKGEVVSYETLLRWQFRGESVDPEEFIPIAESSRTIHDIGLWVLEEACSSMMATALDKDIKLAINISVQQVKQPQFARQVMDILRKTDFPATRLHLEITESVFCDDPGMLLSTISQLKRIGITFGLDDFGTGYSSMVQLQALPFSSIKIDKRFVYDISGAGGAIIKSVILLAEELGMSVIVEGVETQRQLDMVHELGINYVQGYFCSKPRKEMDPQFKPPVVFENFTTMH